MIFLFTSCLSFPIIFCVTDVTILPCAIVSRTSARYSIPSTTIALMILSHSSSIPVTTFCCMMFKTFARINGASTSQPVAITAMIATSTILGMVPFLTANSLLMVFPKFFTSGFPPLAPPLPEEAACCIFSCIWRFFSSCLLISASCSGVMFLSFSIRAFISSGDLCAMLLSISSI